MPTLNPKEAPPSYRARLEPSSGGRCRRCAFRGLLACLHHPCNADSRTDKCRVYFVEAEPAFNPREAPAGYRAVKVGPDYLSCSLCALFDHNCGNVPCCEGTRTDRHDAYFVKDETNQYLATPAQKALLDAAARLVKIRDEKLAKGNKALKAKAYIVVEHYAMQAVGLKLAIEEILHAVTTVE